MGQPTQSAGMAAESAAAAATAGFSGWTPEANRVAYTLQSGSGNKKGSAEPADSTTRVKQFYR